MHKYERKKLKVPHREKFKTIHVKIFSTTFSGEFFMKKIILSLLISFTFISCNQQFLKKDTTVGKLLESSSAVDPDIAQFNDNDFTEADLYGSSIDDNLDDDVVIIIADDPVDEEEVDKCEEQKHLPEGRACLVFKDSFERTHITGDDVFNWDVIVMDNNMNISNIDAKIEDSNHLGPILDGDKAILFRGRQGGSTHEVYLVSKKLDLEDYDNLYIQYRYLPIGLEIDPIFLSMARVNIPESIRIDVCDGPDSNCGLTTSSDRIEGLRDHNVWTKYFNTTLERGDNLNIRNYVEQDWKVGQVVINLNDYPERKSDFVFKITAAIDEGYHANNRNNLMEDGIIFDDIAVMAVNGDCIVQDDINFED